MRLTSTLTATQPGTANQRGRRRTSHLGDTSTHRAADQHLWPCVGRAFRGENLSHQHHAPHRHLFSGQFVPIRPPRPCGSRRHIRTRSDYVELHDGVIYSTGLSSLTGSLARARAINVEKLQTNFS
jgi:hypothetical protein